MYTTPPKVMPYNQYDTPKLSPRVKACRVQQNEYRCPYSTAAVAHQVYESTTAYRTETSSREVKEVQSRCVSVVHRSGQNVSAVQTTAAIPGSITSSSIVVHKPHLCLLVLKLSQQGRRHPSHGVCCGPYNSTATGRRASHGDVLASLQNVTRVW